MEEIVKYFGSGILGGILVAAIQWARISRSEKEKRHSEYVYEQLNRLYGPLFFLTTQNQELFNLCSKIIGGYKKYFEGQDWSTDSITQKNLKDKSHATIELSNSYIKQVVKNNDKINKLLNDNFSYIDIDDIDVLKKFIMDTIRLEEEGKEKWQGKIPLEISEIMGNISYSRNEFLNRIRDKFLEKQSVLKKYH